MKKILSKIFKTTKNVITPYKNGPLHILGNLELKNDDDQLIEKNDELFLCRCGSSNNKPYCDGMHKKIGFQQQGMFIKPPASEQNVNNTGTLEIKVQTNGPLAFRGAVCIQDSAEQDKIIRKIGVLCRCGHTSNSPFCDGTHNNIDFKAE